jgi:hypothetical protein
LVVRGEIDFLLDRVSKEQVAHNETGFARAAAALALAEAYGIDQRTDARARIRHTLEALLPVLLASRSAAKESDPTVVGWTTLAICACGDIGFEVPDDATHSTATAEDVLRSLGAFPGLSALIKSQSADGSWPPTASAAGATAHGRSYTTATTVLALAARYNLLPLLAR